MGEYGDGWNAWLVDENQRQRREAREAKGDFGAKSYIESAMSWAHRASSTEHLRFAFRAMENAGILAAKEARFEGVHIDGWRGEVEHGEPKHFETIKTSDGEGYRDTAMHRVVELSPSQQYMTQIAIRYYAQNESLA